MAIILCLVVPPVKMDDRDADDASNKSLTFSKLAKVFFNSELPIAYKIWQLTVFNLL
jgi:hypothetical protein